jgi:drug/metabolite transporter (DMT)-like permease
MRTAGIAAILVAVVAWGATTVIPPSIESVGGIAISFHRLWMFAVGATVILLLRGGRLSLRLLRLSLAGGLAFGLDVILFFSALKHTTVANATVVGALQPVLVFCFVGPLFGERVRARTVVWSGVAIAGVALVVFGSTDVPSWSPFGDLLAVAALFAFTWYFVASKQARTQLASFEYLTGMTVVAAVALVPVALLSGQRLAISSGGDWLLIALLGIVSGGIGHLAVNWAHAHVDLSLLSLLMLGIPVVAALSAAVFLDQPVTLGQGLGMAVVVFALGMVVAREPAPVPPGPAAPASLDVVDYESSPASS